VTTLLFSHPAALVHDMGPGHPERPDRFRAIMGVLEDARFAGLARP
jgi:acetoin utilization deacetylase AcuC-like enzyme